VGGRVLEGEKPVDLPSSNLHFGVEPSRFVATAHDPYNGCSAFAAGTALHAPHPTLAQLDV
jgi:hypothetical protein